MDDRNVPPEPSTFGWLTKLLIRVAGADEETLKRCPARDAANIRAIAWLMLATMLYMTALFSLVGHSLFAAAGQVRLEIILGALAVSAFILLIDRYVVVISGYHQEGLRELARGGLDILGGVVPRIKASVYLFVRILVLSVGLAQLTAIFVSLLVFSKDIHGRIEKKYLEANAGTIAQVTVLIDGNIERTTTAVGAQMKRVDGLAGQIEALRQNEIDPLSGDPQVREASREVTQLVADKAKADEAVQAANKFATDEFGGIKGDPENSGRPGYGLRYLAAAEQVRTAKARAQDIDKQLDAARSRLATLRQKMPVAAETVEQRAQNRLADFQKSLAGESDKLSKLKQNLDELIAGREGAIRKAVENSPNHVSYDDGFLAQIATLEEIAREDRKIALVIVLIDIVSFGLELAAVMAKVFGCAPTTFSALLARDVYMGAVRIADETLNTLKKLDGNGPTGPNDPESSPPRGPTGGAPGGAAARPEPPAKPEEPVVPPQPVKRQRGRPLGSKDRRPRKRPILTLVKDSTGQEGQGQKPSPPAPA
jgi:hypothetical protein